MPTITLPIANGSYLSDSLPISAQECVNWYPNLPQAPALNDQGLFGTPGLNQLATSGASKQVNRGAHVLDGVAYFVNGTNLYRLTKTVVSEVDTFSMDVLGTIEGTGRVSMADNGTQLVILNPGGKGYVFTTSPDSLVEITDADFTANGNPQYVVFVDGYFLFTTDSKKFIISALNDGTSYNALDFGSAEADPDDIVAPIVFNNQVFIGGSETLEGFENLGGSGFPFRRTGLFIPKGIKSPFSIINANNTFMWVGGGKNESPAIWQLSGNQAQKVSTTAIDSILQDLTDTELNEVFAWTYAQKGAYFVGFALPNTVLVIDTITGRWHERKSEITNAKNVTETKRFRANSVISAYGRVICGDSVDGRVGELDPDTYTEYGVNIIRRVASQPFQNNMRPLFIPSIELTTESGIGNESVTDPKIRMDLSEDGGKTYKFDRTRSLGKIGEYSHRAIWRRNGRFSRFAIVRFTLSDAVKPVVIQVTAEVFG